MSNKTIMKTKVQLTDDVVRELAKKYAAKCWWVEPEELVQEGWAEVLYTFEGNVESHPYILENLKTDSEFRGWVYSAVSRKYARYLWSQSSPVTMNRPDESLRGFHRAPLEALGQHEADTQGEREPSAAARVRGLQALLRRHVTKLVPVPETRINATLYVLLDGAELVEAAREAGLKTRTVGADVKRAQAAVIADDYAKKILLQIQSLQATI